MLIGIWFRAILPLHREWLRGMMVCGRGRCDWLCFLCWVTVWAGCLCFWVLGPGLVVSTAEIAAGGRAVGYLKIEICDILIALTEKKVGNGLCWSPND